MGHVEGFRRLAALALAGLGMGCVSVPGHVAAPYPDPSRVAQGAILGGMAGAAIGAGVDHRDRGRGALIGGLGGVIVGAIFGDQIERHDAWHRAHDPQEHGPWCEDEHAWPEDDDWEDDGWEEPPVAAGPDFGVQEVLFDPGSAKLSRGAESRLRYLAQEVRERDDVEILVRGHSDGSERNGFDLSEKRARVARAFLAEQGVPPRRIAWVGFGDAQPVASNETAVGRQRNRRVEVVLRAPDSY